MFKRSADLSNRLAKQSLLLVLCFVFWYLTIGTARSSPYVRVVSMGWKRSVSQWRFPPFWRIPVAVSQPWLKDSGGSFLLDLKDSGCASTSPVRLWRGLYSWRSCGPPPSPWLIFLTILEYLTVQLNLCTQLVSKYSFNMRYFINLWIY